LPFAFFTKKAANMGKEICNLTFTRESGAANQNWGFRIIGGTDQGQTYKVSHSSFHMFKLRFTTEQDFLVLWDKGTMSLHCPGTEVPSLSRDKRNNGTEVPSLSQDKGTTGQAQNLARPWNKTGRDFDILPLPELLKKLQTWARKFAI
jgi:hypothetical protein